MGWSPTEEDLAFAEESFHAQMVRIREENAAFDSLQEMGANHEMRSIRTKTPFQVQFISYLQSRGYITNANIEGCDCYLFRLQKRDKLIDEMRPLFAKDRFELSEKFDGISLFRTLPQQTQNRMINIHILMTHCVANLNKGERMG